MIYYGDKEYEPKYGLLAEDNDLEFPITYQHLNTRIKDINRNEIVDIEIYTLFSLIHHRHKIGRYDCKEKRKEAQLLIDFIFSNNKTRNQKLIFYLEILRHNLNESIYSHFFLANKILKLKFEKRAGWKKREFRNVESVASHTLGTFYIASLLLPCDSEYVGYNKSTILEMLLYHDLAESEIGDKLPEERNEVVKKQEEDFYSKLVAYSAYGYSNVLFIEKLWKEFDSKNENNINALIAYEIDKLEAYAQLLSYLREGEHISQDDYETWKNSISVVKTTHGKKIKQWIEQEFKDVISKFANKKT